MNYKNYLINKPHRIIITALVSTILLLLILNFAVNLILNGIIKPDILSDINSSKYTNVKIDDLSYSIFNGNFNIGHIYIVNSKGIEDGNDSVFVSLGSVNTRINLLPYIFNSKFKFHSLSIDSLLIKQFSLASVDKDDEKDSQKPFDFLDSLSAQLPFISCSAVEIKEGNYINKDIPSGVIDSVQSFSLKLKNVLIDSTSSEILKFKIAEEMDLSIKKLDLNFSDIKYKLFFTDFSMSSATENTELKNFSFKPYMSDDNFFKTQKFREDRFILLIKELNIYSFNFRELFNNQKINIKNIIVKNFMLDALTNMRLPEDPAAPPPDMPNDIIKKFPFSLDINKMELKSGNIYVKELYPYDETPGVLQFAGLYSTVTNLKSNEIVHLDIITKLAGSGNLKVNFDIGLQPDKMKFKYSGELNKMNAAELNKFISIADRVKITSGVVNHVAFNVTATGNTAVAESTPDYQDLAIDKLNQNTGKSSGIVEIFKSFITNAFVIKKNNTGNNIESAKIIYIRQRGDAFLEYVWKALRASIGQVVGFS